MGRGRAKAKQTKVARSLKYRTSETDFDSLGRELRGGDEDGDHEPHIPDQYADLAAEYTDDDDGDERDDLRKSG